MTSRKVSIGVILSHGFPVPATFFEGWTAFLQGLLTGAVNARMPLGGQIGEARVIISHAFPIDAARNEIVRLFLDHDDGGHLLFLDSDMRHPPDVAHKLVLRDVDVVTGRYTMRKPPFFTVGMRKVGSGKHEYQAIEKLLPKDEISGLLPVDAGGAGVLMIRRRVLDAIRQRIGDDWFRYQVGPDGLRSVSEDMWFYEQAIAAGFQPYLDTDVVCTHASIFEVDPSFHQPYASAFAKATAGSEVTA